MDWFSIHTSGILRGSLSNADDTVQLIWIKLMCMANEAKNPATGRLEFAPGQPYPISYISTICRKTEEEIKNALEMFKLDISIDGTPRISIDTDGTICLNNWVMYQKRFQHKDKDDNHNKPIMDKEHKDMQDKANAFKLAQKHPEDAKAGLEQKEFEDKIKNKTLFTLNENTGEIK